MRSLSGLVLLAALCQAQPTPRAAAPAMTLTRMDEAKQKDWLARWDKQITGEAGTTGRVIGRWGRGLPGA